MGPSPRGQTIKYLIAQESDRSIPELIGVREGRKYPYEDIPTAKEQGIDIEAANWRELYVPKGISDADYRKWSDALARVAASPEWAEAMVANGLAPFTLVGDEFQGWLDGVIGEIETLSREFGVIQ